MLVSSACTLMHFRGFRLVVIGVLLAAMGALGFDSLRRESVTLDEPLHLTAGYTFWALGDYRLQESHGALPQRWFALPLVFSGVKFPFHNSPDWQRPGYLGLSVTHKFLFESENNPDVMIFLGRLMALAIALLVPLAVYGWASRLFGPVAGLIAAFFCALDPTVLAHGRLMTSDITAALLFLMSVGCIWNLLRCFTYFRLAASTICFGLLMVSKMSGALVVPMAALMFLTRTALKRPWPLRLRGIGFSRVRSLSGKIGLGASAALAHFLVMLAIIWCMYGWQYRPSSDWQADRDSYCEPREAVFDSLGSSRVFFTTAERWKIVPDAYLYGLAHTVVYSAERPTYLDGNYGMTGWWYYFPYCFLIKTPLTLLVLIGLGAVITVYGISHLKSGRRRAALLAWVDRTSPIWSLVLVYSAAAVLANLNIGHRHLLPIYLPLFILAGATGAWLARNNRWSQAVIGALLLLQIVVVARIHPDYLAYFNELVGGPRRGYLHLTDSNVDWGQNLPALSRWLSEHPVDATEKELYFNYFGFDSPRRWGINARSLQSLTNPRFSSANPIICRNGIYCYSATALILPGLGRPPWDADREREYRQMLAKFREMEQAMPVRPDDAENVRRWQAFLGEFVALQNDRLRSYLVGRKPDEMIGYSILIFRLSDEELRTALLP